MGGARSGLTHSQLHSHTIHQVREGPAGQVAQSSDVVTVMTCAKQMVLVLVLVLRLGGVARGRRRELDVLALAGDRHLLCRGLRGAHGGDDEGDEREDAQDGDDDLMM